jgi:hypothetical protein
VPVAPIPGWEPDETGKEVPAKVTVDDFRRYFLMSFPKLAAEEYDGLIQDAIDTVYAMFAGVNTMWDIQPKQVWHEKSQVCYRHLTAWYITDRYPDMVAGYSSVGGLPLTQKKVDGVDLRFDTSLAQSKASGAYQDALSGLRSNHFGRAALMMIQSAAKRAMLRNRKTT